MHSVFMAFKKKQKRGKKKCKKVKSKLHFFKSEKLQPGNPCFVFLTKKFTYTNIYIYIYTHGYRQTCRHMHIEESQFRSASENFCVHSSVG